MRFELGVLCFQLANVLDGQLETALEIGQLLFGIRIERCHPLLLQLLDSLGQRVALGAEGDELGGIGLVGFRASGQVLLQLRHSRAKPLHVFEREFELLLQLVPFALEIGLLLFPCRLLLDSKRRADR